MFNKFTGLGKNFLVGVDQDGFSGDLPTFSVRPGEIQFVYFFTEDCKVANVHYLQGPAQREVYRHIDEGCLLCQARIGLTKRIFLPIFNLSTRQVESLALTQPKTNQPRSLFAQIYDFLSQGDSANYLAVIHRPTWYNYKIERHELGGFYKGDREIRDFVEGCEKGTVKLVPDYPIFSSDKLADYPDIAHRLELFKRFMEDDGAGNAG